VWQFLARSIQGFWSSVVSGLYCRYRWFRTRHRPFPWVLGKASLESCMLYARLLAKHRETSPCLIAHCLPQFAV